jgi:hypothetical protein
MSKDKERLKGEQAHPMLSDPGYTIMAGEYMPEC